MKKKEVGWMKESLSLLFIALVFLINIFSLPIGVPSMYDDELFAVMPAFRQMGRIDQEYFSSLPYSIPVKLSGKILYYMVNQWTGPSYLIYIPFFSILGISVASLRITKIIVGLLTLLMLYIYAKRRFGLETALIASLLAATFPFNIYMFRQGFLDDGLLPLLLLLSLYLFQIGKKCIYLAIFTLGLGLSIKLNFVWFIVAFIGINIMEIIRGYNLKKYMACLLIFLVGASPLIYYNISAISRNNTFRILQGSLHFSATGSYDNLNLAGSIITRLGHIKLMFADEFKSPFNHIFLIFFIYSLTVWSYRILLKGLNKDSDLMMSLIFLLAFSCFTISILRVESLSLMTPFFFLIPARLLSEIIRKNNFLGLALIALIIFANASVVANNNKIIRETGTRRFSIWFHPSSSISELSKYLIEYNISSPMDLTPNYVSALLLYSGFRLRPSFCTKKVMPPMDYRPCIDPLRSRFYIVYPDNIGVEPTVSSFKGYAEKSGMNAELTKIFYFKNNVPEIALMELKG